MPYERKADRIMKRFFALLLCMLICISVLPTYAFADGDHQITVNGGTASSSTALADTSVSVTADVPDGQVFTS